MQNNEQINPNRILWVISMAAFLVPFMGSAINLALPEISDQFSLKAVTLTWISTSYLISTAIFQIPFARIADLIGRKKIFIIGILIFTVGTSLCGFAHSGISLIIYRVLSGIGSAMIFGTSMAILTSVFPKNQRGKALGINATVVYASVASGPFLGGFMTHYWGWQSIFFIGSFIGLVIIILAINFINGEWIEAKGEKFDWIGSVIYAIAIFGIIYGFSNLPQLMGFIWIAIGIIAFVLFVFQERHCKFPVYNLKLFKGNRVFLFSSLAALINYAATYAISFMISLYLQYIRGFDAHHAGLILISSALVQSFCSFFAGRLSDKFSPFKLATLGMSIIVAGLGGLIFLSTQTPIYLIIILLIFLGIGFGIFASPNTNIIMSSVDKKNYGQASATTGTVRLVGQSFSMGIAAMAISTHVGSQKIVKETHVDFMNSIQMTFIVFFVLCLIGVYASTVSGKNGKFRPSEE